MEPMDISAIAEYGFCGLTFSSMIGLLIFVLKQSATEREAARNERREMRENNGENKDD